MAGGSCARSSRTSASATPAPTPRSIRCGSRSSWARPCCASTPARRQRARAVRGRAALARPRPRSAAGGSSGSARACGMLGRIGRRRRARLRHRRPPRARRSGARSTTPTMGRRGRSPTWPRARRSAAISIAKVGSGQLIATGGKRSAGRAAAARRGVPLPSRRSASSGTRCCARRRWSKVSPRRGRALRAPPPLGPRTAGAGLVVCRSRTSGRPVSTSRRSRSSPGSRTRARS